MKQKIRNGGKDIENERIIKLRWNKWLDKVEKTGKMDE
jgi:predicted ABC-type ATPase